METGFVVAGVGALAVLAMRPMVGLVAFLVLAAVYAMLARRTTPAADDRDRSPVVSVPRVITASAPDDGLPPTHPVAQSDGAFRTVQLPPAIERADPLYESHLDHALHLERLNRGHAADVRHLYTKAMDANLRAARADLPLKDPNLVPLDPQQTPGCPRDLTRW